MVDKNKLFEEIDKRVKEHWEGIVRERAKRAPSAFPKMESTVEIKLISAVAALTAIRRWVEAQQSSEDAYLVEFEEKLVYNPNYGDDRVCVCGHPYYRHFDSYDDNEPVGCKYCSCFTFVEQTAPV